MPTYGARYEYNRDETAFLLNPPSVCSWSRCGESWMEQQVTVTLVSRASSALGGGLADPNFAAQHHLPGQDIRSGAHGLVRIRPAHSLLGHALDRQTRSSRCFPCWMRKVVVNTSWCCQPVKDEVPRSHLVFVQACLWVVPHVLVMILVLLPLPFWTVPAPSHFYMSSFF